jgi:hypothetical protein
MQGNCNSEPSASALGISDRRLEPRTPGQCVLVTDQSLMEISLQNLWLDSLYIRYSTVANNNICCTVNLLVFSGNDTTNLWLTSVTLQGEANQGPEYSPLQSPGAITVRGAQLYAEGGDVPPPFS